MKNQPTKILFFIYCSLVFPLAGNAQDDWTFQNPPSSPPLLANFAMAAAGDDQTVLFGGYDENFNYTDGTWVYDLSDNTWTEQFPAIRPSARAYHAMASLGGGKVLLYGGDDGQTDTWMFDIGTGLWTLLQPATNPGIKNNHAMAFIGMDKVLLYGGISNPNDETWVYDLSDNNWTLQSPASNPGGRYSHGMAYIGDDKVVLFGGQMTTDDETWVYDLSDNAWVLQQPIVKPSPREYHAMAYLGEDRVLLFGGLDIVNGPVLGETWIYTYSDDSWIQLFPMSSPSPRYTHAMASGNVNRAILLGWDFTTFTQETWLFTACGTEICNGIDDDCDGEIDEGVQLSYYLDADGDGYGDPDQSLDACEQPANYVGTGTDCDDTNSNIYPGAPELADGLDNDCDGQIDEEISSLSVSAGDCEVVYLGYGPQQCQMLQVSVSGGLAPYTYMWSSGAQTESTSVCPVVTTIYTVTVTDQTGDVASDAVTVQVIDVQCGNNNDKVLICHLPPGNPENVQTLCVASSAVEDHLAHGDHLGACNVIDPCEDVQGVEPYQQSPGSGLSIAQHGFLPAFLSSKIQDDQTALLFPNPADRYVNQNIPDVDKPCQISFFDVSGKLIQSLPVPAGLREVSTAQLPNGIYFVRLRSAEYLWTTSLVVIH